MPAAQYILKMKNYSVVGLLLLVLAISGFANVDVTRTNEALILHSNQTYTVKLGVTWGSENVYGIIEEVPEGWIISNISDKGILKQNHIEWLFSPIYAPFAPLVAYSLTVPENTPSRVYALTGYSLTTIPRKDRFGRFINRHMPTRGEQYYFVC
jgi:hypothetical protein